MILNFLGSSDTTQAPINSINMNPLDPETFHVDSWETQF